MPGAKKQKGPDGEPLDVDMPARKDEKEEQPPGDGADAERSHVGGPHADAQHDSAYQEALNAARTDAAKLENAEGERVHDPNCG